MGVDGMEVRSGTGGGALSYAFLGENAGVPGFPVLALRLLACLACE